VSIQLKPLDAIMRTRRDPVYLDEQPEIATVIHDWLESLRLDPHGMAFDAPRLEEIECRGRDGFIPHSWNRGGFDLEYQSDLHSCVGSGCGPDLAKIDQGAEHAYKCAADYFRSENAEALAGIPADKVNYHDLYELGRGDLAEELSECETEYMRDAVTWGVRAIYHGPEAGTHALTVFCSGNVSEYYGAFGKGSEDKLEVTLHFKTASGLARQLARLKSKVEGAF
jgi:hypothetical protein